MMMMILVERRTFYFSFSLIQGLLFPTTVVMVLRMGKVFAIIREKKKQTFHFRRGNNNKISMNLWSKAPTFTSSLPKLFNSSLFPRHHIEDGKQKKNSAKWKNSNIHPLSNVVTSLRLCHNILSKLKKCHRQMLLGPKREPSLAAVHASWVNDAEGFMLLVWLCCAAAVDVDSFSISA